MTLSGSGSRHPRIAAADGWLRLDRDADAVAVLVLWLQSDPKRQDSGVIPASTEALKSSARSMPGISSRIT
jgi:hypothetical protein